jgi:excisionase family DNA binding protein
MMEDQWLSTDKIAAYPGIKRYTVYRWIAEKGMPAHRMGRLWKFRKEEVDDRGNLPDVYRVDFGLGRKGGAKAVARQ